MKEGRLNLRIDVELVEWVKHYCASNGMTVSAFIRMFLLERKRDEEVQGPQVDAEQI
jgi:antitoxin component of RelBE/YafQ-DinJ toxin-antitoxin module